MVQGAVIIRDGVPVLLTPRQRGAVREDEVGGMSDVRLILGDCLDVLRDMPDGSVDAVITDPPYGAKRPSAWRLAEERFAEVANNDAVHTEWLSRCVEVCRGGAAFYLFTCWQSMEAWRCALAGAGLSVRSCIVWDKGIHGLADVRTCYAPRHEFVLYATKGRREFSGRRPVDIIAVPRVSASRLVHPYEKPVALLAQLLADGAGEGATVLDPFMGSGTTGVACVQTGRNFIGIEIDEGYFNIAKQRIEAAQSMLVTP
jgi:site-specific DNA-methyltransferase (adenine-specific)